MSSIESKWTEKGIIGLDGSMLHRTHKRVAQLRLSGAPFAVDLGEHLALDPTTENLVKLL